LFLIQTCLENQKDNKIDFCKVELGENSKKKLDELDEKNAKNHKIKNEEHKLYIEGLIKLINDSNTQLNRKNSISALLFTPFGMNPLYYNQSSARIVIFLFFTVISFICFYFDQIDIFTSKDSER
jgi:hypothetical protein